MKKPRFKRYPNEFEITDDGFEKTLVKYYGHKKHVIVPSGITIIDDFAFKNNADICKLVLPKSCKCIRDQAFRATKNLRSIKMPETMESVAIVRFRGDAPLYRSKTVAYESKKKRVLISGPWRKDSTFKVPPSVRIIASNAFVFSNAKKVIVPKSVRCICNCAFDSTSKLTRVYFDKEIKSLGSNLFGCGDERFFKDDDGCWYESENRHILLFVPENTSGIFKVCASVLSIECEAFEYNEKLEEVILPKGLKSMSSFSFAGCSNLKRITIPDAVKNIAHRTFENCSSLAEVILPHNLEEIGTLAFISCSKLESIIIPEKVKEIDFLAFAGCRSLKEVIFKGSFVRSIGRAVFQECTNLQRIVLPEFLGWICDDTFKGCTNLKEIILSRNLRIDEQYFSDCNAKLIPWDEYYNNK